uniref:Putative ovule protein n=1 Tax=Solanum chacoense TaxID=4108 RepID=A0A0V0GXU6_SOLCH
MSCLKENNIKDCKQGKKEHVLLLCLMCEVSDMTPDTNSARNIRAIQITKRDQYKTRVRLQ